MTTQSTGSRVKWVDVAKGIAILLVVLQHAVLFAAVRDWAPRWLIDANDELATFRMPLFFLASGMFAARSLSSSWSVVLRKRIAFYVWVYVLWLVIRYAFFAFVPNPTEPLEGHDLAGLFLGLVLPSTGLWFIFGLAVFSFIGKLIWRVPPVVQLTAAAVLSASAGGFLLPIDNFAWRRMAMYLVFFLAGAHLSKAIRSVAEATNAVRAGLTVGAFVAASAAVRVVGVGDRFGVTLVVSVLAVAAGISLSVLICDSTVGRWLFVLGQRTIDVYLPHVMIVGGLTAAVAALGLAPSSAAAGALLVLGVVMVTVPTSLLLASGLRRIGGGWLFAIPEKLAQPSRRAETERPGSAAAIQRQPRDPLGAQQG